MKSKVVTACLVSALLFSCFAVFTVQPVAAYTGTITYSAATNTITAVGGTAVAPIGFIDIYNADVAGSWGKVALQGTNQFLFNCKIIIGDGSTATFFADSLKQITFLQGVATATSQYMITIKNAATCTLGQLVNIESKTTSNGVSLSILEGTYSGQYIIGGQSGATVYLYSCTFESAATITHRLELVSGTVNRIWNCVFKGNFYASNSVVDAFNLQIQQTSYYGLSLVGGNFSGVRITNQANGAMRSYSNTALNQSGTYIRLVNNRLINVEGTRTIDTYWLNFDSDTWVFNWAGTCTGLFYRQYEFDLTVLNGEITEFVNEANVTLTKGGVVVGSWLTNSSGQIDSQVLTYGYYAQATGDTLQGGADPFVLTVTHPDWADYTSRFYVTEKTKMTISMQESGGASDSDEWFVVGGIVGCVFAAVVVGALLLARKND